MRAFSALTALQLVEKQVCYSSSLPLPAREARSARRVVRGRRRRERLAEVAKGP
ncbi:MAG: hypothetical protein [Olavius algarvensis Gamma 1 endosymbiont]|nr:MAG: hypothetical protein [Olavius algarvensis Gamma 1 endosymbiont]